MLHCVFLLSAGICSQRVQPRMVAISSQRSSMPHVRHANANVIMDVGDHLRTMEDSHRRGDAALFAPPDVSGRWRMVRLRRIKPAVLWAVNTMLAVLLILCSPMQASAMGGGAASGGGGSSQSSPSPSPSPSPPPSPSPSYSSPPSSFSYSITTSPPSSTVYVFPPSPPRPPPPPPRPRTKAEIKAAAKARAEFNAAVGDLAEAAKWPLVAVGAAYAGNAVVKSQTRASTPTGGRSQETILSDRRSQVNRWPGRFLMDKELELRPPDGNWTGEYMEAGCMGKIGYDLKFDHSKETFQGSGKDPDGSFIVENGVFLRATGRFMWTQRAKSGSGYLVVECVASVCNVKSDGFYGRPGSLDGNYATTAGYRGKFTIGPLP